MTSPEPNTAYIYIDEIDKITKKSENVSIYQGCFQAKASSRRCLRFWRVQLPAFRLRAAGKHPHQELLQIDTTNIPVYLRRCL